MNDTSQRAPVDLPQLRTLLLTDLCDSTGLVERLGDVSAAALFREHDRLVLELQQRWRGRLIDRSDGLLLLFERPIDGLGFALDYVRGLRALGEKRSVELQARAGLHVGEVLTWRNTDEAVQVGAKPLEVEGLAKPMAARLMAMARPGQILLSAVAEPLAHRAARELGERGQHLLWKTHGRWRFKGVPDSQQIYEVGEPGIAPLRMPQSTPKAWRDIPLWRRPAALAAEVALIAAVGIGAWFVTRPQPAIAFNQRDWVVVADLRNLTGQAVLDDSLEQAFRISLEQSRYVNVLSDMKARDTLARMRRPPGTPLDRMVASEVALRDGARAVILPTVAEVGGKLRISAEVIDPHTQSTMFAKFADGNGAASALESVDKVTAALRGNLGEAIHSIQNDSMPLPAVTTTNLDALRAYALAQNAYARYEIRESLQLFQRATELDPQFALAWLGLMRVQYGLENTLDALPPLRRAQALRSHLPPREAMYVDAWISEFDEPSKTSAKWVELARMYPDYMPGRGNAAIWLYKENRFDEALRHAQAAVIPQNPLSGQDSDTVGRAQLGKERYDLAQAAFDQAWKSTGGSLRRLVATAAARRDFVSAQTLAKQLDADSIYAYIERTTLAVDQGQFKQAQALARMGQSLAEPDGGIESRYMKLPIAVADWLAGEKRSARQLAHETTQNALAALKGVRTADVEEDAALMLSATLVSLRIGDDSMVDAVLNAFEAEPQLKAMPHLTELAVIVRAERARRSGRPEDAIKMLAPLLTGRERYQTHVVLMDAYADAGQHQRALLEAKWLKSRRGLAYIELECGHCLQALNIADSNRALEREAKLAERAPQSGASRVAAAL